MQQSKTLRYRGQDPTRLDLFLTEKYATGGYIRSYWRHMIDAKLVLVNGKSVKAGTRLKAGDLISVQWPKIDYSYRDIITTLYEDDDVLVLNKPAGMLVHSKGSFNPEFTVADFVADNIAIASKPHEVNRRAGIVHRLDRHTSGVMIVGRTDDAVRHLQKQFAQRLVRKEYVAIVHGKPLQMELRIDMPIIRDPTNPKCMTVSPHGKQAVTHVRRIGYDPINDISVLRLQPETGRTHQLRVHLSQIGNPIIGDTHYHAPSQLPNGRFLLHAKSLELNLPQHNDRRRFVAELPADMSSYMHHAETSETNP